MKKRFLIIEHKKARPFSQEKGRAFYRSRGGRIRTYGLVVPNDARYRAALHPENLAKPMGRLRSENSK